MDSLIEREVRLEYLMPMIREYLSAGKNVTFSPQGYSMLPMIRQGKDSVVISPLPEKLRKYDLPLYQRDDGHFILHRVVKVADTYTCIGDNQFDYEPGVRHDQLIAIVTGFYREGKYWSVTDPRYRIYCRLRHYSRPLRHLWRRGKGWLKRHLK